MLVHAFCEVFGDCVVIAGEGVVINWPVSKGGWIWLLEVELSCRGAGNKTLQKK